MTSLNFKDCPYISDPITIEFDGKLYNAREGDTVASALLRNDIRLIGRSFKYQGKNRTMIKMCVDGEMIDIGNY